MPSDGATVAETGRADGNRDLPQDLPMAIDASTGDGAVVRDTGAGADGAAAPGIDASTALDGAKADVPLAVSEAGVQDADRTADLVIPPYRIDATGIDALGGRYVRVSPIAGQPVVLDTKTRLVWQGCPAGVSGDDCTTGKASKPTRIDATIYCRELDWAGYQDWFLPDQNQLRALTSTELRSGIDTEAFPGTPSSWCAWSSTTPSDLGIGWAVCVYHNGNPSSVASDWNATSYARCVRSDP